MMVAQAFLCSREEPKVDTVIFVGLSFLTAYIGGTTEDVEAEAWENRISLIFMSA